MILGSLVSYYEALAQKGELKRSGWEHVPVGYAIYLRQDGSVRAVVSLKKEEVRGEKTVLVSPKLNVPEQVVRTSGKKPNFMCDTAAFLLGLATKDKQAAEKYEKAKALHLDILGGVDSDAARTVCRFFENHTPEKVAALGLPEGVLADLGKGNRLTFADGDGHYLMDDSAVGGAWDAHYGGDADAPRGRCLVTGEETEIAVLHNRIKGVMGAKSSGASLVSFNQRSFESYGKEGGQGRNAPVGRYAMYAYTTALNYLLSGKHCTRMGDDVTVVWWTLDADEASEDLFGDMMFGESDDVAIRTAVEKISRGEFTELEEERLRKPFCVLGLSPNASRLSVRFFYRNTFGSMLSHIAAHYRRLSIEGERRCLTPYFMALETLPPAPKKMKDEGDLQENNKKNKAISPAFGGALLSAILNDQRYPEMLYSSVLTRARAEREVTPAKAAIIKAYLLKNTENTNFKEVLTMALNEESTNCAYVLGRLFAALETAQYNANKNNANKTNLRERYLASACATPGLVFPRMIQTAVHHTAKSGSVADEKLIGELLDKLDGSKPFPARLSIVEQGLFLEGYYHQVQKKFRDIENNKKKEEERS